MEIYAGNVNRGQVVLLGSVEYHCLGGCQFMSPEGGIIELDRCDVVHIPQ